MMTYDKYFKKLINDLEERLAKAEAKKDEIQGKLFLTKIEYQQAREKNGKSTREINQR
tara:strand:- start:909 stop:1082 length:174 start_codon:yes stop_codon:yes gene_type:complete